MATDAGATSAARDTYPTIYSQEYESQFLAHATMEPMNCTARVAGDTIDVWGPTQGQEITRLTLASVFKLPKENIQVSRTLLGGGFGRRLVADFALQATLISKAVARPVKVVWSREEDMQHDIYRPATLHRITAGINEYGKLGAIAHRLVSPSILQYVFAPAVTDTYDPSCLEGLLESHYDVPNIRVDFKLLHVPVPTSVLRTTGFGQLAAIGRRTGVANILGINFSGFSAWWLWRTIYLSKLPRFEKKLRVAFDWTLELLFSKDLVQFLDIRAPMVSRPEAETGLE